MSTSINLLQPNRPSSLNEVRDILNKARKENIEYFPSPFDWRDEVLYFLLPDRFSDGKETSRPLLSRQEIQNLRSVASRPDINWQDWAESGNRWQGGTIKGIQSGLDYIKNLGITAIWIAPVFKQRVRKDTYHGYGIQDFLETDSRFGSREDLIELVAAAHARGLRIILDIIINHSGDNWGYVAPGDPLHAARNDVSPYKPFPDFYGNPNNPQSRGWKLAWKDETEKGFTTDGSQIQELHDGVWPRELQSEILYTRAGKGSLDDNELDNPHAEHKRTDFYDLKDIALDAPQALNFLSDCFKYWIALTDCDGYRIDTVKHISLEDARNFCGAILEFAETIGKKNFFLVGEIAGDDRNQLFVLDNLALLQRNLKAALDIGSNRIKLSGLGKGFIRGIDYLENTKEASKGFESHRSFGNRIVTILDDHDHVMGEKIRFSAGIPDNSSVKDHAVVVPTAIQLFSLGIPCIYYGTEQAFAGPAQSQLPYIPSWNATKDWAERYLRECMFGPEHPRVDHHAALASQLNAQDTNLPGFGAFGTCGKHCFDTLSPSYIRIAALCELRKQYLVLRVGRQYTREIRIFGKFELPAAGELLAWSRILDNQEAVCIVNPNGGDQAFRGGDVVVSSEICSTGDRFKIVANTLQTFQEAQGLVYSGIQAIGSFLSVQTIHNICFVEIRNLSPCEVLILVKE